MVIFMSDIDIARSKEKLLISEVGKKLGLSKELELYGNYKAKIDYQQIDGPLKGKLILVTAINPTPYGEGKTTVSIGLVDALAKLNKQVVGVLREPSLGPVFGMKGGATGGGLSQVVPMEDINLNFTGDLHAITSANALLSAAIDNHIKQGNELNIDINNIQFKRCMDVNDRALKNIIVSVNDNEHKEGFNITAASEVMAVFCLAKDIWDLKEKLGNILVAYSVDGKPIFAKDLKVNGAMAVLLKEAIKPNLVQTLENNPVIIHGGPFANIAHGCNSIMATKLGLTLSDYVVTEAGFGADLGALKFFDIKCRLNDIYPDAVVLVVTMKALKHNGYSQDITKLDIESLRKGLPNLQAHLDNLRKFTNNIVVCINKYSNDYEDEIQEVVNYCNTQNVKVAISTAYVDGGLGAVNLANEVLDIIDNKSSKVVLYDVKEKIKDKISKIVIDMYGAGNIVYSDKALKEIKILEENNLDHLPVCIAKTQYSLSDDKDKLGRPMGYEVTVRDIKLYNGAGFITVYLGSIITMPGLPKVPNYEQIDIDSEGNIVGIF